MKRLFYILALSLTLFACDKANEMVVPEELGVKETNIVLPCTAGSYNLDVLADGDYTLTIPDDVPWLTFEGGSRNASGNADASFSIKYEMNRGIARSTVIGLDRGKKHVEVTVSQEGVLSSGIEFEKRSITVSSEAASHSVKILTLCKDSDLDITVSYKGAEGWIRDLGKSNNFIMFSVIENAQGSLRVAEIKVSSKSDPSIFDVLQVGQLPSDEELIVASFGTIAEIAAGTLDPKGKCIAGVVIADNSEGNGAPNLNISASMQDNTFGQRTAYIQSYNGSAGVMVIFDTVEDNITRRYDNVILLLDGVTVTKYENPTRYVLTDVTSANLVETRSGSSFNVVKKEKTIAELTDSDIYTFVTLKDCEIPVRKGPFVPIDIRHRYVINRYPMVIRDKEGGTMHLMTNLTAAWQRDGKGIPEGSGSISGVIVHETCDNFEWDDNAMAEAVAGGVKAEYVTEIGEIGPYQIRPVTRAEIDLAETFEDGFSGLIMEVRYYNKSRKNIVINVKGNTIYSTYPAVENPIPDNSTGELDANSPVKGVLEVVGSDGKPLDVATYRDWNLLGPLSDWKITDPSIGNGVTDYYGNSIQTTVYSAASTTGLLLETCGSGWYCTKWTTTKYWRATFSTKGLTEANFPLSVQFGAANGIGEKVGAPRYWTLEYSTDGSSWTPVANYTVPDFPILSNRKAWQCPGYKFMSFNLPEDSELLGKDKVQVRMHPVNKISGTPEGYADGTVASDQKSELNYFAIRYNK